GKSSAASGDNPAGVSRTLTRTRAPIADAPELAISGGNAGMKRGTARLSNGIWRGKKRFDPTQTQPLSWRMQQGQATPLEDVPVDPKNRQTPTFDDSPPERLSVRGYRLRARLGSGRLGAIYEAQDELSRSSG